MSALFLAFILELLFPTTTVSAESPHRDGSDWHYGGSVDLSYALDFNFPDNNRWRSKSTTTHVNELAPNMVLGYLHKDATPQSRWGMEFGMQTGYDTDALVPEPNPGRGKPVDGADTLRHFSRANVSYLALVGNGLTLTARLFNSYIGYESMYSKSNLNYTRSYIADNSPYFVFGVGATYPVNESWQIGLYVINGYNYLAYVNNQPRYGTQVVWKAAPRLTVTENLYSGPDQSNSAIEFWRSSSDSIIEWKDGPSPSPRSTISVQKTLRSRQATLARSGPGVLCTPTGT